VALRSAAVFAAIAQIALGHDPNSADGGEHAAFGAVDLVHAIAVSDRTALTSARQVEVLREHVTLVAIGTMITIAAAAAAAAVSVAEVVAVAVT
jgi:hypothetical protein